MAEQCTSTVRDVVHDGIGGRKISAESKFIVPDVVVVVPSTNVCQESGVDIACGKLPEFLHPLPAESMFLLHTSVLIQPEPDIDGFWWTQ